MPHTSIPQTEIDILLEAFPQGIVAFDLETTGLSPYVDRVVELAAVKIDQDKNVTSFESLVNPQISIPLSNQKIHHISDEMVKNSPLLESILPQFLSFVKNSPLIAHNASFDMGFLIYFMQQSHLELIPLDLFDSLKLARKVLSKGPANKKLETLGNYFELPRKALHRALDDSLACIRVVANCLLIMKKQDILQRARHIAHLYNLSAFKAATADQIPQKLQPLLEFVGKGDILEIEYLGGTVNRRFRPVIPVGILPMPKGHVLYAQCVLSSKYKNFVLKKIKSVQILDELRKSDWKKHLEQIGKKEVQ